MSSVSETGRRWQWATKHPSWQLQLMSNRNEGDYQEVIDTLRRTQLIFEEEDSGRRMRHSNNGEEMTNNHNGELSTDVSSTDAYLVLLWL